jgi:DNA-directed RNA polymerase specialized sigma24 family protein
VPTRIATTIRVVAEAVFLLVEYVTAITRSSLCRIIHACKYASQPVIDFITSLHDHAHGIDGFQTKKKAWLLPDPFLGRGDRISGLRPFPLKCARSELLCAFLLHDPCDYEILLSAKSLSQNQIHGSAIQKGLIELRPFCMVDLLRRYSKGADPHESVMKLGALLDGEPVPRSETGHITRIHRAEMRLGRDRVAELGSAYESGLTIPELQRRFGLSKGTVSRLLRESGVEIRRHPVDAGRLAEAVRLYESGLGIREVGAQLGIPKTTVQNALRRAGVAMRPGGRPRKLPSLSELDPPPAL